MTKTTRKTKRLLLISILLGSIPGSIFGQSILERLKAASAPQSASQPPKPASTPTQPNSHTQQTAPANDLKVTKESPDLGATLGKYDIAGVKLGMGVKEAVATLRAYNPKLQFKPDSVKYDVLQYALTYGMSAMAIPTEKFYFFLTMAPNQESVSTIGRYINFTKDNAPTEKVAVEDIKKKYGVPTRDTGPMGQGYRILTFADDEKGKRLSDAQLKAKGDYCLRHRIFLLMNDNMASLGVYPPGIDSRIEKGSAETYTHFSPDCWDLTVTQVTLFIAGTRQPILDKPGYTSTAPWLGQVPEVVGNMMVIMSSGPLDRVATEATFSYLQDAIKAKDAKSKEDAQKNRPPL
jgi:hypothetical protein